MVHGLFTSLAVYALTIAAPLAAQHRIVLYDLRGHGLSEQRDEGYTPEMLAQDMIDLMDDMGIARAGIVGYSYGGSAVLYAALHHPERVERLALLDAMLLEDSGARDARMDTDAGRRGRRPLRDNGADETRAEAAAKDEDVPALSDEAISDYTASTGIPVTEANRERMRLIGRHFLEPSRFRAALRANQQLLDELSSRGLTMPALLLYGKQSPYLDMGHTLASCLPSAQMHTIEGDHNLPVLQGETITRYFREFFEPTQNVRKEKGTT
jgi:pimeloyl-ACP methyl ester carboxylesterase